MFTAKGTTTAITIGIVAFLGLQVYGFYSMRRSLDTRLGRIESGIEAVRAADIALTSQIGAQATKKETITPKPSNSKVKDAKAAAWNDRIAGDRKLAAKLQSMLPAGTNLKEAASGFRSEREFISAVYVSKNLRIPFAQLKAKVTGNHPVAMEAALHDLRPGLSKAKAKSEVQRAEGEARETEKLGRSA